MFDPCTLHIHPLLIFRPLISDSFGFPGTFAEAPDVIPSAACAMRSTPRSGHALLLQTSRFPVALGSCLYVVDTCYVPIRRIGSVVRGMTKNEAVLEGEKSTSDTYISKTVHHCAGVSAKKIT